MHLQIVAGFFLDLIFGDPQWFPHPVRGIGRLISIQEMFIRKLNPGKTGMKVAGIFMLFITVSTTAAITHGLLKIAQRISPVVFTVISVVLIYFELATKCLADEAIKVYTALKSDDIELARKRLSYIVGRDTEKLEEAEIIKATVETVAENTSDGVIAPLFYVFVGGPVGGMVYKAVNTLDSMVGYMDERYRYIGWASAKFDDIANWIPARITAFMMLVAGFIIGKDFRRGYRILSRDCRKHKSPNSGFPEAAIAGLMGIRLGGTSCYFGKPVYKPFIGDAVKSPEAEDILDAVKIMYATSVTGMIIFSVVTFLVNLIF